MKRYEEGFTLIEVIIAMVIMGIGFSIFVQGFIGVNDSLDNKLNYTYLSNWAVTKLNELESGIESSPQGSFVYRDRVYKWQVITSYINPKLMRLKLVINWDAKNSKKEYSLSRIVIKKD